MANNKLTKDWLEEEFVRKQRSTLDIAKELNCFPMQVRRALKKFGIQTRDKSAAQLINLERNGHPFEGRERTTEEKEKISLSIQQHWESLPPAKKKKRKKQVAKIAKDSWNSLSLEDKNLHLRKMHQGSVKASKHGSKLENLIAKMLVQAGYKVEQRATHHVTNEKYEIDIAIYSHSIAIEIDGPTHFLPIYGDDHLKKVMDKDREKDNMLRSLGWTIIRCRDKSNNPSKAVARRIVDKILKVIPLKDNQVHYLDIE